jgi:hypothetical protein
MAASVNRDDLSDDWRDAVYLWSLRCKGRDRPGASYWRCWCEQAPMAFACVLILPHSVAKAARVRSGYVRSPAHCEPCPQPHSITLVPHTRAKSKIPDLAAASHQIHTPLPLPHSLDCALEQGLGALRYAPTQPSFRTDRSLTAGADNNS